MPEKQEIISGIKNAMERGYSLDLAVQSFANAGYSKQDVEDSARVLGYSGGILAQTSPQPQAPHKVQSPPSSYPQKFQQGPPQSFSPRTQQVSISQQIQTTRPASSIPLPPVQKQVQPAKYLPPAQQQPIQINMPDDGIMREKSWLAKNWLIIFLGALLFILIIALGASVLAKDWVLGILKTIGINLE
jgi:hypothetical protein